MPAPRRLLWAGRFVAVADDVPGRQRFGRLIVVAGEAQLRRDPVLCRSPRPQGELRIDPLRERRSCCATIWVEANCRARGSRVGCGAASMFWRAEARCFAVRTGGPRDGDDVFDSVSIPSVPSSPNCEDDLERCRACGIVLRDDHAWPSNETTPSKDLAEVLLRTSPEHLLEPDAVRGL